MKKSKRSSAVPLTIVPALAALVSATACQHRPIYDPCEQATYLETACDSAVVQHGYWYGGTWYPRVYAYAPYWYYSRYNRYVLGGGIVHSLSPTIYAPGRSFAGTLSSSSDAAASRASVVRGGFGGIGSSHASAGS